ncbi:2-hydroxy-3-keto-5-methylthiopentenyl-1-phosphate phosphatase, partial [Phenoliferia sp. Uapishka_3]
MTSLPYADSPYILFSDFDGTITTEDSNDAATDNLGFGLEKRRALNVDILNGKETFRDAFRLMINSIAANKTFDETREYLKNKIKLDPGFKECFDWCKANGIPVVIVSSGMVPIIRAIMENLVGVEDAAKIDIIANDVEIKEDGSWTIKFRHPESGFGHDKSRTTAPYRNLPGGGPTLFFCGDGVSDLSAARAADLLFVKVVPGHTNDLQVHCFREKIPYLPFEHFLQVRDVVAGVVGGKITIPALLEAGPPRKF